MAENFSESFGIGSQGPTDIQYRREVYKKVHNGKGTTDIKVKKWFIRRLVRPQQLCNGAALATHVQ